MADNEAKIKLSADADELKNAVKEANNNISTLNSELKLNEARFKNTGNEADYLAKKHELLEKELAENIKKQESLNAQLELAKKADNSDEVKKLTTSLTYAQIQEENLKNKLSNVSTELIINEKNLMKVSEAVEEAGEKADKSAQGGFTVLKGVVSNIASNALSAVSSKSKEVAKDIVETGKTFDTNMSQVAATMGTTVDKIENMKDKAQEMGATTEWTSSDAAEALNYLALAGYSSEQAVSTLPTVLNLASAGAMNLGDASDMVTDAMTALGIEADAEGKNITTFGDQMAKTASNSNTSVSQLGEAILTVGGTAKSLSGGTTELNTALGILADNSIKGSEGGTHLRNILLALNPTTDKAVDAWESLGISAYDTDGNLRPLQDTFADLNKAMAPMTDEERTNLLTKMFNKTDLSSVNALLATSSDRWDKLGDAVENSGGAMADMAATQLDNLEGDITLMDSAVDGLYQSIYSEVEPTLRDVVGFVTNEVIPMIKDEIVPSLKSVVDWLKEHKGVIVLVASVIGILVTAYTAFSVVQGIKAAMDATEAGTLKALIVAKYEIATATLAQLAPYILIVAAIAAVIAIIILCIKNWDKIKVAVSNVTESIKTKVAELKEKVTGQINKLKDGISNVIEKIKSKIADMKESITKHISNLREKIRNISNGIRGIVIGIVNKIISGVEYCVNRVIKGVNTIINGINKVVGKVGSVVGLNVAIPVLSEVSLPRVALAKGGIVGKPTNALIGEGGEPEAVAPISVLKDYIINAVQVSIPDTAYVIDYNKLAKACANISTTIQLNNREVGRVIRSV